MSRCLVSADSRASRRLTADEVDGEVVVMTETWETIEPSTPGGVPTYSRTVARVRLNEEQAAWLALRLADLTGGRL